MMKKVITRMLAFAAVLLCGGAWAGDMLVKWDGDLDNGSVKAHLNTLYTMSSRSDDSNYVSFANGVATTSNKGANNSRGVMVDFSGRTEKVLSVIVKYSGYDKPNGWNTLLSATYKENSAEKETMVLNPNNLSKVNVKYGITTSGQAAEGTATDHTMHTSGYLLATFDSVSKKIKISIANSDATFQTPVEYTSSNTDHWPSSGYIGIKVGGSIVPSGNTYRPNMTIEGITICSGEISVDEAKAILQDTTKPYDLRSFNGIVQSDYTTTGWKIGSIDELMSWNFSAEMIGGGVGNRPVATRAFNYVKNSDGTVKVEFHASNTQTKGVGVLFKIGEDGTVHVKGVGACYFNRGDGATSQMCNANGTPLNPGGTTIAQDLATTFDGGNYGVQNIIATPCYTMSNALSERNQGDYASKTYVFNLPAASGYVAGSVVVVKKIGLAVEGNNDLPAAIKVGDVASSSRTAVAAEARITDGTTIGKIVYYSFDKPLYQKVGTAADSFTFLDANGTDVTAASKRLRVAKITGDTGKKISALTIDGESTWAPICDVYAEPVDDFYFGQGNNYWKNVYKGPAADTTADFHSADQWVLNSGSAAPLYSGSNSWEPSLVNGDLLTNIEKGDDGYKTLETGSNNIEGWNIRLGLINGVKLTIGTLAKIQGGETKFFGVDETSKLVVTTYSGGNNNNNIALDIASAEGVEFVNNVNQTGNEKTGSFAYIFRGNGSMKVNGSYNIGASHKIKHVELALGTGSKIVMKEKKVIAFTSSNISDANIGFDTDPEIILTDSTTVEGGVLSGDELTKEALLGKAAIVKKTDGIYVVYFGYGEEDQTGTLTISGLAEGVSVESVTADGVAVVAGENQTYTIPFGAQVVITYTTTEDGKVVAKPTQSIGYLIKDTTVSTGHPILVDYPTMSWGSDQNLTYLSRTESSPTLLFASEYSLQDISEGNCAITGRLRGAWVDGLYDTRIVVGAYDTTAGTLKIQAQIYQDYTKVQTITLTQVQIGDKYLIYALGSLGYYVTDRSDQRGNFVEKTNACTTPSSGANWDKAYEAIALSISTTTVASIEGVNYSSIAKAIAEANGRTIMLEADITEGLVVPNGVTVNLNGHTVSGAVRVEYGGLMLEKIGENSNPKIDGYTTSFDIVYNDTKDFVYKQEPTATSNIGQGTASYFTGDANNSLHGIYLKHQPYIGNIPGGFFDNTSQLTMAIVGTMPSEQNTIFAHMGDAYDNTRYGVFLATGSKPDEVVVRYNNGQSSEEIASMTVPKASTARHLYIITKQDSETKAVFTVYLDGQKWKTASYDKFIIKGGVQLGNTFNTTVSDYSSVGSDSTSYVNVLRIYDRVISAAEIARYKEVYAYKSLDGNFERTFTAGSADWSATGAWTKTSVDPTITVDLPMAGVVDAIFDGATTVTVNSDAVNYEKLTLSGTGPVTLTKGEDATSLKAVCTIVNTQVTLGEGAIDLTTGPTVIGESGKIIFDFSSLTTAGIIATPLNLPVTGDIDEDPNLGTESAKLVMSCNESNIDRDQVCVELVYDSVNNCYNAFAQRWAASYAGTNYLTLQEALDAAEEASALPTAVTIKDGTTELPEGYEDYVVADNGSVIAAVAKVGGKGYLTLPEAVEAATEGQTVTLLADVTLSSSVNIVSGVTLDIGSNTISGSQVNVYGAITGNGTIGTLVMVRGSTIIMPAEGVLKVSYIGKFDIKLNIANAATSPLTYLEVANIYSEEEGENTRFYVPSFISFIVDNAEKVGVAAVDYRESDGMYLFQSAIAIAGVSVGEGLTYGYMTVNEALEYASSHGGSYANVEVYDEDAELPEGFMVVSGHLAPIVAKIGSTPYPTLPDTITAAEETASAQSPVTVTLARNVTLQEALTIPANVTVDVNGQTFSGAITGSGKIKYAGFGSVQDAVRTSLQNANWTGTLVITQPATGQIGANDNTVDGSAKTLLNNYGNVNSKIEFDNCTGTGNINYIGISHNGNDDPIVIQPEIVITGDCKFNNGYTQSDDKPNYYTIIRKLSGTGTINSSYAGQVYYIQDGSEFAGAISTTAKKFVFGNRASTDAVIRDAIIAIKADNEVTVAPGKIWSANAIVVNGTMNFGAENAGSARFFSSPLSGSGTINLASPSSGQTKIVFTNASQDFRGSIAAKQHAHFVFAAAGKSTTGMAFNNSGYVCVETGSATLAAGKTWSGAGSSGYGVFVENQNSSPATLNLEGDAAITGKLFVRSGAYLKFLNYATTTVSGNIEPAGATINVTLPEDAPTGEFPKTLLTWEGTLSNNVNFNLTNPMGFNLVVEGKSLQLVEAEDVTESVEKVVDNQTTAEFISLGSGGVYTITGKGGLRISGVKLKDGSKFVFDPVRMPVKLSVAPMLESGATIELKSVWANHSDEYSTITCGKIRLFTYPSAGSVATTGYTIAGLKDDVEYSLEEESVADAELKQLVLYIGDYKTAAKPIKLTQFGDSITEGIWRGGYEGTPNYRIPLMHRLEAHGFAPTTGGFRGDNLKNGDNSHPYIYWGSSDANGVPADPKYRLHNGISAQRVYTGMTGQYLRAGFVEGIEAYLEASGDGQDVITLKIGTNDLLGGETGANIFEGWLDIVKRLIACRPNARIVVTNVIKSSDTNSNVNGDEADAYNNAIADAVANNVDLKGHVFLIDARTAVGNSSGSFLSDGIHPNWVGHNNMADAWYEGVTRAYAASTGVSYEPNVTTGAAANVPAAYRKGFVKLATMDLEQLKKDVSQWGSTPYTSVNSAMADKTLTKIAYYVERSTTGSANTQVVWVDMDPWADTATLANMGVPNSGSGNNKLVNNLHVWSNTTAIDPVDPETSDVKGTLLFTITGLSKDTGVDGAPVSQFDFDWNDKLGGGSYGALTVSRVYPDRPVASVNSHRMALGQTLFCYNGFNNGIKNILGIGDFAVHCQQSVGNSGLGSLTMNWISPSDYHTYMGTDYLDHGVIEIWGVPANYIVPDSDEGVEVTADTEDAAIEAAQILPDTEAETAAGSAEIRKSYLTITAAPVAGESGKWTVKAEVNAAAIVNGETTKTIQDAVEESAVEFAQQGLESVAGATETTNVDIPAEKVVPGLYYSVSFGTTPDNHTQESERVLATDSEGVTIPVPALGNEKVYYIKIKASATK